METWTAVVAAGQVVSTSVLASLAVLLRMRRSLLLDRARRAQTARVCVCTRMRKMHAHTWTRAHTHTHTHTRAATDPRGSEAAP